MNHLKRLGTTSVCFVFLSAALALTTNLRAAEVPVVTSVDASSAVRLAVNDLIGILQKLHPKDRFVVSNQVPLTGQAVLIGSAAEKLVRPHLNEPHPTTPESFVVQHRRNGALDLGVIAGADPRGTVYGIYALLEKLGCGFYLTGDTLPPVSDTPFDLDDWELADQPLVAERLVFNWHNFLSSCSTWNLTDWQRWTAQSQKMGYNAIMVHAYGNNPMAEFSFQGVSKPVGYLSTTIKGRDWSTMHVNDVRRLYGGEVFNVPAFGADAGLVPDDQRVAAAKSLMKDVFADAAQRNMGVYFALDVDTPSANPQELVRLLPESARFQASGATSTMTGPADRRIWLTNPDTPEGYALVRAQVAELLKTYPQITKLVVWFRRDGTPWMNLKATDLPTAWQKEYAAEIARTPEAEQYWRAPGIFAMSKMIRAFDRAVKDCNATKTSLAAGTWGFDFLPAADRFFPAGVPLIGLDYDVLHGKPQLGTTTSRASLRKIGKHRPVIPVVWAHHDDGHYIGRPYTPQSEFASKLDDAHATGFGIIHWTTRPLDIYFSSLACQVWNNTRDQPLREICGDMAERWYGSANRAIMGEYLESWITEAPRFGRDTSDWFIDRKLTDISAIVTGCRTRLAMIDKVRTADLLPEQQQRLNYQRGLEEFIAAFHHAHGQFQDSQDMLKKGDLAGAKSLIAQNHPEAVIEQFARFSSIGGMTRGEQGLLVSLNTRWLSHIVRHRQTLGLEPVRINFAPTSHDRLAQARGTYTFHFGPNHELWECWGEEETAATVVSLPLSSDTTKDVPPAWSEVSRAGIEINKPLELTLRPIMTPSNQGNGKAALLPPGTYRLHLLVLAPESTADHGLLDVVIADPPSDRVDVFHRAGRSNRMVDLSYSVTIKAAGTVKVTLAPNKGKVVLCGAVLEPMTSTEPLPNSRPSLPHNSTP